MGTLPKTGTATRSSLELSAIVVPKASDVLVEELRERILSGELAEGSALPTERDLVTQTRMSRTTVREALRILEIQGLLRIRAGRAGGAFVRRPNNDLVANSISLLIRGKKIRLTSLLQAREAIEPVCAQLAAEHRSDDDLATLRAANSAVADMSTTLTEFLQANVAWHVAVAAATHNEILSAFMSALSQAIYSSTENERFVDMDVRRLTARAHQAILESIEKQDSAGAVRRMKKHIHGYAEAVLTVEDRTDIYIPASADS